MRCFAFPFVPRRSCCALPALPSLLRGEGSAGPTLSRGAEGRAPRCRDGAWASSVESARQPLGVSGVDPARRARSRQGSSPTQTMARSEERHRRQAAALAAAASHTAARTAASPALSPWPWRLRHGSRREATTGANGTPHPNPERKVGLGRWSTSVCRGTLVPGSVCFPALQVRSGWGGAGRSGVDSDLLQLQPVARDLDGAKTNSSSPLWSDP